jgi:hypothetical protein
MFRLEIREAREEYVADLAGNNVVAFLVGRKPIGTCDNISEENASYRTLDTHIPSAFSESVSITNL